MHESTFPCAKVELNYEEGGQGSNSQPLFQRGFAINFRDTKPFVGPYWEGS